MLIRAMLVTAPDSLTTERLVLRRFGSEDRARYVEIRREPGVAEWLGHDVENAAARADWFLDLTEKNWRERGVGPWAVTLRDTGELVGHAGLWYLEHFEATELMYGYSERVWGRGIATEAGRAVLDVAFHALDRSSLIALVTHANLRSQRVVEKLGFRPTREATHRGFPVIVHELTRPD